MNKLTNEIARKMQPTAALIAYTCEDVYSRNYYLEIRSINKNGLMGAGKPVSVKFVQSLVERFSEAAPAAPHGEIPQGMLYADIRQEKYVWHRPPCRKYLYFKNNLNIPNGNYCLPGLVWKVEKESLFMYSYKAKRLTPNTQLYAAPFFNVRPESGSVCLGNAKLELPKNLNFLNFIKFWEDKFFLSEFSHVLGGNPTRSNLIFVVKNSVEKFDNDELLPVKNLKLTNLLK